MKKLASHDIVRVHDMKRQIALAFVRLTDGRNVFVNPNLVPAGVMAEYKAEIATESRDGQA